MTTRRFSVLLPAPLMLAVACGVEPEATDQEWSTPSEAMEPDEVLGLPGGELATVPNLPLVDEQTWLVELTEPPAVLGTKQLALRQEHARFWDAVLDLGLEIQPRLTFHRLWNGMSVRVSAADVEMMRELPNVKAIYPVVRVEPGITRADPAPNQPNMLSALAQTGVDIVQNTLGFTGAGVRVGIIDSGIDYHHPDLGGCFGAGCKVAFGKDLVGSDYNGTSSSIPVMDDDPDDCSGHGTHVAGIVAANGVIKGVAPNATLGAYRVFGCTGGALSDLLIKAMELADADNMRVVNISIGASFRWPDYPVAKAATALVQKGVMVSCPNGNSGSVGLYGASACGVAPGVLSAAWVDNTHVSQRAFRVTPDGRKIGYNVASGVPPPPATGAFPLARTGTVTTDNDACSLLPAGSLTGQIALIRRGTCSFYIKCSNAQAAGAAGVVLYNNAAGPLTLTAAGNPPLTIPVVAITNTDGAAINTLMDHGSVDFSWTTEAVQISNATGNLVNAASSWGPDPTLSFKPDLAAPGGNIYSTYPLELGRYASSNGSSMAAPHVAGALALLLQAKPVLLPAQAITLLRNTAKPVAWTGGATNLESVIRQGAGLIQVDDAILTDVTVEPSALPLGELENATAATRTLVLRNQGTQERSYSVTHAPAMSVTGDHWSPTSTASGFAAVTLSSTNVVVPAQATVSMDITVTPDVNLAANGFFGGYVVFEPSDGSPTLRVPYSGFKGDCQTIGILTAAGNGYPWLARYNGSGYTNLPSGGSFSMRNADKPYVVAHLDHATALLRIEAVAAGSSKLLGLVRENPFVEQSSTQTATASYAWDGVVWQGSRQVVMPNGEYVLKLSVLKALGDTGNPAHWETWTSPVVTIRR